MRGVAIWDGLTDGRPWIADDHPRLDPDRAEHVVDYLTRSGAMILRVALWDTDRLDPDAAPRVGMSTYTDGEWWWDGSLPYYVRQHRLSPGTEFLDYLAERRYETRHPSEDDLANAREHLHPPVGP